jgi:hypothetical protein
VAEAGAARVAEGVTRTYRPCRPWRNPTMTMQRWLELMELTNAGKATAEQLAERDTIEAGWEEEMARQEQWEAEKAFEEHFGVRP